MKVVISKEFLNSIYVKAIVRQKELDQELIKLNAAIEANKKDIEWIKCEADINIP
jgi:hypothetical protein